MWQPGLSRLTTHSLRLISHLSRCLTKFNGLFVFSYNFALMQTYTFIIKHFIQTPSPAQASTYKLQKKFMLGRVDDEYCSLAKKFNSESVILSQQISQEADKSKAIFTILLSLRCEFEIEHILSCIWLHCSLGFLANQVTCKFCSIQSIPVKLIAGQRQTWDSECFEGGGRIEIKIRSGFTWFINSLNQPRVREILIRVMLLHGEIFWSQFKTNPDFSTPQWQVGYRLRL